MKNNKGHPPKKHHYFMVILYKKLFLLVKGIAVIGLLAFVPVNTFKGLENFPLTIPVQAQENKEAFTINDYYTISSVKVNFIVKGYLINGSLSKNDEVTVSIRNVPSNITPPKIGIINFSEGAGAVWLNPKDSTVKHSGSVWNYTFTKEMIATSDLFNAQGELKLSIGGYYDLAYNGKPIIAEPGKLKVNCVDANGNPLDHSPEVNEVSYEELDSLDEMEDIEGYQLDYDRCHLKVPNTTDADLKEKVNTEGSLSGGVKAILDDPTYGGGKIQSGSTLTLVYQSDSPTATIHLDDIDAEKLHFNIFEKVDRQKLIDKLVSLGMTITLRDGTEVTDYENLTFSSTALDSNDNVITNKSGTFDLTLTYDSEAIQQAVSTTTEMTIWVGIGNKYHSVYESGLPIVESEIPDLEFGRHIEGALTMNGPKELTASANAGVQVPIKINGEFPLMEKSNYVVQVNEEVEAPVFFNSLGFDNWQDVVDKLNERKLGSDDYFKYTITYVYKDPVPDVTITTKDLEIPLNGSVELKDLIKNITLSDGTTITDYSTVTFTSSIINGNHQVDTSHHGVFDVTISYQGTDGQITTATAKIHILPKVTLITKYVDQLGNNLKPESKQEAYGTVHLFYDTNVPTIDGTTPSLEKSKYLGTVDGQPIPPGEVTIDSLGTANWYAAITAINTNNGLSANSQNDNVVHTITLVYEKSQVARLVVEGNNIETISGNTSEKIVFQTSDDDLFQEGYTYMVVDESQMAHNSLKEAMQNAVFDDSSIEANGKDSHEQVFTVKYTEIPKTGIKTNNATFIILIMVPILGFSCFLLKKKF